MTLSASDLDDFESAEEALRPGRSLRHPQLREAAALLENNRLPAAAKSLREFQNRHPRDASALHLSAELAARRREYAQAEVLFAESLALAPGLVSARYGFANMLLQANKPDEALEEAEQLLAKDQKNPLFRGLKAVALEAIENYTAAAAIWKGLIEDYPDRPDCRERYGHPLRGLGLGEECVATYRKALELDPSFVRAYWSLANLKTFRFDPAEIERMESLLANTDLSVEERTQLLFALGKAYGDEKLYEKSFANYAKGNALHRLGLEHDPDVLTSYVAQCKRVFTAEFMRERAMAGCRDPDPIFIVGMARSGSTLVEQILASHSQIEGTRELFDLAAVSQEIQYKIAPALNEKYPHVLKKLDNGKLKRLGESYIDGTRIHRKLDRPFFTDKTGANFVHVGLVRLILPNARIVDVRRHPLACGLSNFVQLFAKGQNYAYRLPDIGRLYRDYVDLMAHFDRVSPGTVHRVIYENLVADPETEVRRLLDYLALPFEPSCLQFHKTERVVATVSSEQVRKPIYRDALEQWRHYEPWLGPLGKSLGDVLTEYPNVPDSLRTGGS